MTRVIPETTVRTTPTTEAALLDRSVSVAGWEVWIDLSFSLSHEEHFHSTASLHSGQNSDAAISLPHALQSICMSFEMVSNK